MKRTAIILMIVAVFAGIGWGAYQGMSSAPNQPLAQFFPAGSLLSLEAKDFDTLLQDWNSSPQKKQWLQSNNYEVFSRSRLLLRLKGASDQFAAAAGLQPDINFLAQVAGTHSMMAIYDIGNLQFLYITYLPSAQSMQTKLWQARMKFEPRALGSLSFYVRRDPESQKEVAFAIAGDYLLLATKEELMADALQLVAGSKGRSIEGEGWWSRSASSAGAQGDLRMILNLEKIIPSPYFRTYWIQKNITDLKQYSAGVTDLFRSSQQYREERVLLRKAASDKTDKIVSTLAAEAAADLVRFVPDTVGIYEAEAAPSADFCLKQLESKLLVPQIDSMPNSKLAPAEPSLDVSAGLDSDLETRIDSTETQNEGSVSPVSALSDLLQRTPILAALQVQSSENKKSGVFVKIHSAIALRADSNWEEASVRSALAQFVQSHLTTGQLGVAWQQKSGYQQLDGLWPLAVAVREKYLIVTDDPAMLEAMLANFSHQANRKPATFIGSFKHGLERATFTRLTGVLDHPNVAESGAARNREPQFFSENLGSLSNTFAGISRENVAVYEENGKVLQTVTYQWSQ